MNWLQKLAQSWLDRSSEEKQSIIQDFIERWNIPTTPDGKVILYHGTRSAPQIRQQGKFLKGTYFSPDPDYAQHAGGQNQKGRGKMVLMKIKVDPMLVSPGIHWVAETDIPVEEVP